MKNDKNPDLSIAAIEAALRSMPDIEAPVYLKDALLAKARRQHNPFKAVLWGITGTAAASILLTLAAFYIPGAKPINSANICPNYVMVDHNVVKVADNNTAAMQ